MRLQREDQNQKIAPLLIQLLVVQPVKIVSVKKNKLDILLMTQLNKQYYVLLNVLHVQAQILALAAIMVSILIKQHPIVVAQQEKSPILINLY